MRKLIAIFVLVATLVGCDKQQDDGGLDITIDGGVETSISVSVCETRAGGVDSAEGIFEQGILGGNNVIRYVMMILIDGKPINRRYVAYSTGNTAEFLPTLIPGRDYKFVVWADVVINGQSDIDNHYNTSDLTNITFKGDWNAMDETRDAFTGYTEKPGFMCDENVVVNLTRPFAKLRIVATDKENTTATPVKGIVRYTSNYSEGFDAVAGKAKTSSIAGKVHEYALDTYTNDSNESYTLFTDYLFVPEDNKIDLEFAFYEEGSLNPIMDKTYTANDIIIKSNQLTSIKGEILSGGEVIVVTADIDSAYYIDDGKGGLMD